MNIISITETNRQKCFYGRNKIEGMFLLQKHVLNGFLTAVLLFRGVYGKIQIKQMAHNQLIMRHLEVFCC